MPKAFILVPGYGAQGGKGADLVHFFNEDGLGAIINSSRGIIAAYQQEKYAQFGEQNYADASRAAVLDMREDIAQALAERQAEDSYYSESHSQNRLFETLLLALNSDKCMGCPQADRWENRG